jgi:hypothetical protein
MNIRRMLIVGILAVVFGGLVGFFFARATKNQEFICNMADLVSHVPVAQFEGEPFENFVGWIEARQNLLDDAREGCSEQIIEDFERRVRLDEQELIRLCESRPAVPICTGYVRR